MNADIYSSGKRWFFLSLIMLFVVAVRVRLLDVPLERDEGEYAYMGQLLLQGIPPYSAAYNMKFPGAYLMYAGIMALFGQSIRGIHIGFMIVNCATVLLLFYLGRKLMNDFAAVITSCTYAVLSLSSSVFGFAAHATHFVVLPAVGGALLLLNALERNKPHLYFLSGTLFGLAFLMKQPGIFFTAFGVAYILYHYFASKKARSAKETISDLVFFLLGALAPLLVTVFWLYTAGVFDKFRFWTIQYAAKYAAQVPLSGALDAFKDGLFAVTDAFPLLWIASALGFAVALFHGGLKKARSFVILFTIFSFLSICPGFYFRPHYFVTLLPATSLLIGILIHFFKTKSVAFLKWQYVGFIGSGIFIAMLTAGIASQRGYLFQEDPVSVSRSVYGANPFPESLEIAKFIQARSTKNDRIAVLGSEPQIYFYSRRLSATGHIYMYGLMEHHDYALSMQKEMISQIESSSPKFIVMVWVPTSWLTQSNSEKYIFSWIDLYIQRSYQLVGVADILSSRRTVYQWNDDAAKYKVQSPYHVLIFERREGKIPPD
jgi:4-amino-4-deoxy-L-arabinose transferase-like glycosyltransferase